MLASTISFHELKQDPDDGRWQFLVPNHPDPLIAGQMDIGGVQRFAGFLMAVREINDKSDGIMDDLLPGVSIAIAAQVLLLYTIHLLF